MATGTIALNTADEALLTQLRDGRNVPANLAADTGYHRQYVYERLKRLAEHGVVRNVGNGVYELVEDPNSQTEASIPEPLRDVEPTSAAAAVELLQSDATDNPITEGEMRDLIRDSRQDWGSGALKSESEAEGENGGQ